jgi:hypothetical protein
MEPSTAGLDNDAKQTTRHVMDKRAPKAVPVVDFDFDATGNITQNHIERTKAKTAFDLPRRTAYVVRPKRPDRETPRA